MRNRMQDIAQETLQHERDVRDLQNQLEQVRLDRDEWKRSAEKEKAVVEDLTTELDEVRRELDVVKGGEEVIHEELDKEREKARNLQAVLQDFQAGWSFSLLPNGNSCIRVAKDHELRQAVKDYESQLVQVTQSLAEFKSRALNAEVRGPIISP